MRFLPVACIFGIFLSVLPARADHGGAVQTWLNTSVSQRLDYGLEFQMEAEQWLSAESRFYQHYELTPQAIWHYSPRYDFSLGYEESRTWDAASRDTGQPEALGSVTFRLPLKEWLVTSRQRFQGGPDDAGGNTAVFRQRKAVSYQGSRLPFHLTPFLADEWFCDLANSGGITENRLQFGVSYPINREWKAEIYAMRHDEQNGAGQWTAAPVVGINLSLFF